MTDLEQKPTARRVKILGIPIDDVTEEEVIAQIRQWVAEGGPHQICTVNPEFVMAAQRGGAFRRVLLDADICTPDGFGLLVAARWRGTPLRTRVTGVGLTEQIAAVAAREGWSMFLLGAAPGVAERAAELLVGRYPGLQVAGCHAGTPRPEDEEGIRQRISAAQPDVLLVAYGHPAQELWIARNQPLLRVPAAMGVGGTFDEISGLVRPTPAWVQRLGLKWAHRLIQQPQRWRRVLTAVPLFMWAVLREPRAG